MYDVKYSFIHISLVFVYVSASPRRHHSSSRRHHQREECVTQECTDELIEYCACRRNFETPPLRFHGLSRHHTRKFSGHRRSHFRRRTSGHRRGHTIEEPSEDVVNRTRSCKHHGPEDGIDARFSTDALRTPSPIRDQAAHHTHEHHRHARPTPKCMKFQNKCQFNNFNCLSSVKYAEAQSAECDGIAIYKSTNNTIHDNNEPEDDCDHDDDNDDIVENDESREQVADNQSEGINPIWPSESPSKSVNIPSTINNNVSSTKAPTRHNEESSLDQLSGKPEENEISTVD